jgi:hypothetical protein
LLAIFGFRLLWKICLFVVRTFFERRADGGKNIDFPSNFDSCWIRQELQGDEGGQILVSDDCFCTKEIENDWEVQRNRAAVEKIGKAVFWGCKSLEKVSFAASRLVVSPSGGLQFII